MHQVFIFLVLSALFLGGLSIFLNAQKGRTVAKIFSDKTGATQTQIEMDELRAKARLDQERLDQDRQDLKDQAIRQREQIDSTRERMDRLKEQNDAMKERMKKY